MSHACGHWLPGASHLGPGCPLCWAGEQHAADPAAGPSVTASPGNAVKTVFDLQHESHTPTVKTTTEVHYSSTTPRGCGTAILLVMFFLVALFAVLTQNPQLILFGMVMGAFIAPSIFYRAVKGPS